MLICGLKLTHDGAISLIKDNKLLFCVEMEKINNNFRHSEIIEAKIIKNIIEDQGYDMRNIDIFAIDGWGGYNQNALAIQPRLNIGSLYNKLDIFNNKKKYKIKISAYREKSLKDDVLGEKNFNNLLIKNNKYPYLSFNHVAGHILSAYFTSPFAIQNNSSYILIWDGGMYPRLYFFNAQKRKIHNLGPIFLFIGNVFSIFAQHFGPFKVNGNFAKDDLSIAGKVMAYIGGGIVQEELFDVFDEIYYKNYDKPMGFANVFANKFKEIIADRGYSDADILASMHKYFENLLINKLKKKVLRFNFNNSNLCYAGGCALNIKWNSAIKKSGIFKNIYIPPFPNDSGSAIGVACCVLHKHTNFKYMDWDVYSGLKIVKNGEAKGWVKTNCSLTELAKVIHESGEPVVFLNGNSEIGPRALGNRSIIASAAKYQMKSILNEIKKRENYRPISPICMKDKAMKIFNPGTKDPFMLFDHQVRAEWIKKIPAVVHSDKTARLQTINRKENKYIYKLLYEYEKLSGIPLLCNTSANYHGRGFFSDLKSAMLWNKVNYIWNDNVLFEKKDKIIF